MILLIYLHLNIIVIDSYKWFCNDNAQIIRRISFLCSREKCTKIQYVRCNLFAFYFVSHCYVALLACYQFVLNFKYKFLFYSVYR